AEEAEELAVRELPLDADLARPLHPAEAALRPQERPAGRRPLLGRAEDRERRVAEEPEASSGPEQAVCLGQPAVRVAPDARAVLRDREVEALRRERGVLRARLEEREHEAGLLLTASRGGELGGRDVDADRPPAAPRKAGGDVSRPAAELHGVARACRP